MADQAVIGSTGASLLPALARRSEAVLIPLVATDLPALLLGFWSDLPQLRAALEVNVLFLIGIVLALGMAWMFRATRVGLIIRVVGDSTDAARAMGLRPALIRTLATATGGAFAGVEGAYLSLYYPGSWNEGISSGQGLMAVALVIFACWNPIACFGAALLFGGPAHLVPRSNRSASPRATTSSMRRPTS